MKRFLHRSQTTHAARSGRALLKSSVLTAGIAAVVSLVPTRAGAGQDRSLVLPRCSTPLVGDIRYPAFKDRPKAVTRLEQGKDGRTILGTIDLPDAVEADRGAPSAEDIRLGRALLDRSTAFLTAQPTARVRIRTHTNEQGSMGFVGGGGESYDLTLARPNLVRFEVSAGNTVSRFISNGRDSLRIEGNRAFAEPAPSTLAEMVGQESMGRLDGWRIEMGRIVSLFDPEALDQALTGCSVHWGGSQRFGGALVDRIVIRETRDEPSWDSFAWDLFLARGPHPVPLAVKRNFDGVFNYIQGKQRFSDSWLHFTDWVFNEPDIRERFVYELGAKELVSGLSKIYTGDITVPNPMMGRDLPSFTASKLSGGMVRSSELTDELPLVLVLTDRTCNMFGSWYPRIVELEEALNGRANVIAMHGGGATVERIREEFEFFDIAPDILVNCDALKEFADGSFSVNWSGQRVKAPVGSRIAYYVVGMDGVIQSVFEMGSSPFETIPPQIEALLEGRDVARENLAALESRNAQKAAQRESLRRSFAIAPPPAR